MSEFRRIAGFLAAGALNTAIGYGLYGACIGAGLKPALAVVISTVLGVLFNFASFGRVFQSRTAVRLPRFLLVYGLLMLLNLALLHALMTLGLNAYAAQALVVLLLAPVTYLALRRFVFGPAESAS